MKKNLILSLLVMFSLMLVVGSVSALVVDNSSVTPENPLTTDTVTICADVSDIVGTVAVSLSCDSTLHTLSDEVMEDDGTGTYCTDIYISTWQNDEEMSCDISATDDVETVDLTDAASFTYDGELPTADAGSDQEVNEGEEVTFDGSGSSDSVTATPDLIYSWDFGDGETSDLQNPTHTYADDGEYVVTLIVEDEAGQPSEEDTMTVTVNDLGPTAVLTGDAILYLGESGSWDASSSTSSPDEIEIYEWDWDYDGSDFIASGDEGETQTHTYESPGTYVVAVRVTDDDGSTSIDTLSVDVRQIIVENLPTSEKAVVNKLFTFDVDASEIPPGTLTFSLTDAPAGMSIDPTTGVVSWTPDTKGTYTATVEISDGTESISEDLTVTVYDYKVELSEEWNLFSIPLVPEDTSIDEVLGEEVSSNAEVIWAYQEGEWKYNTPDDDGWNEELSLKKIIPGYGYYIKMKGDATMYKNGEKMYGNEEFTVPKPPVVTLTPSWNLIGHYGLKEDVDKVEALDTLAESYSTMLDMDGNSVSDATNLSPTEGYWLFVTGTDNLDYAPSEEAYS